MICLKFFGDLPRVAKFIIFFEFAKTNRERLHRAVHQFAHQRNVQTRIYTARKKDSERNIGHHSIFDGTAKQKSNIFNRLFFGQ